MQKRTLVNVVYPVSEFVEHQDEVFALLGSVEARWMFGG